MKKGSHHTQEARQKFSLMRSGKPNHHKKDCACPFCRDHCGEGNSFYNHKHKEESRKIMSLRKKGKPTGHREGCQCCSCKSKRRECYGDKSGSYIDGRSKLRNSIRGLKEYHEWRELIFQSNNYTCQECGKFGGHLEAHHHKVPFKELLNIFLNLYSRFSPVEDKETLARLAMDYAPFWELDNGITLCEECHKETRVKMQI